MPQPGVEAKFFFVAVISCHGAFPSLPNHTLPLLLADTAVAEAAGRWLADHGTLAAAVTMAVGAARPLPGPGRGPCCVCCCAWLWQYIATPGHGHGSHECVFFLIVMFCVQPCSR